MSVTGSHRPIEIAKSGTPEWHAARKHGIGASEAAMAAGISEWGTPLDLYLRKRGEAPPVQETRAMTRGKVLEPLIVRFFAEDTGREIIDYPMPMFRHPEHSFMLATPDAMVGGPALLEIKTVGERGLDRWRGVQDTDDVPVDVLAQVQQQCAVMGIAVCHVAVWLATDVLLKFRVERNENFIDSLIAAEKELWERVQNGDPPLETGQYNLDAVRHLYRNVEKGEQVNLSLRASEAWARRQEIKAIVKELETEQDELDAEVLAEMGDVESGILPGGQAAVKRIKIQKPEHTVKATEYTYPREVKHKDGGGLVPVLPAEIMNRFEKAEAMLKFNGFLLLQRADSGSRYYRHHDGRRVRVSDHAPSKKTMEWMKEKGCDSIRVDDPDVDLKVEGIHGLLTTQE